jgi:sensor c-di-GMP phosphodiesterase-like protein
MTMSTVAEGVETEEQLAFLREHGCQSYQGFLYSRALPAAEVVKLLAREEPSESAPRTATRAAIRPAITLSPVAER